MTSALTSILDPATLTPRQIVAELDKYIVGQAQAKRAVAIALRNRYRRARAREDLREEITPKNILMIGPTGVGKTEIARRLAALVGAPFVKVEATKYTEVGYVGRDVESMVRDLVEASIRIGHRRAPRRSARARRARQAVERVIDVLHPETRPPSAQQGNPSRQRAGLDFRKRLLGASGRLQHPRPHRRPTPQHVRDQTRGEIERGFYDVRLIEIEVEEAPSLPIGVIGGDRSRRRHRRDAGRNSAQDGARRSA